MTDEQVLARAAMIAAGEHYHREKKARRKSKHLFRVWLKAKARCAALGL